MFYHKSVLLLVGFLATAQLGFAAGWETDYAKALETAKRENKRVLVDFTGSDWCGPCIQLHKRAFSRSEFIEYAEKNLVLVEIDYPQRKKQSAALVQQNERLAEQYGIGEKGYPTLVLLDPSGKIVRELSGYDGETAADIIAWIEGKGKR